MATDGPLKGLILAIDLDGVCAASILKEGGEVCPNQPCLAVPGRSCRLTRGQCHRETPENGDSLVLDSSGGRSSGFVMVT
jgi:hypothetical protein